MKRWILSVAALAACSCASASSDLVDALKRGGFTTFAGAVAEADPTGTMRGTGPITVFAPTEAAFADMSVDERLLLMSNPSELRAFVREHIVTGPPPRKNGPYIVGNLSSQPMCVERYGPLLLINGLMAGEETPAANAVIYAVDTALVPASLTVGLP